MATRPLSLISFRPHKNQRAHFSIFVPSAGDPSKGTLIHVVGAPMVGFSLEFKRNYSPADTVQPHTIIPIGDVYENNILDSTTTERSIDTAPRGNIEIAASQVPPPRISQNFLAPVDGVSWKCTRKVIETVTHKY